MIQNSSLRLADSPVTSLSKVVIQKDEHGLPHVDPIVIATARKAAEEAKGYTENLNIKSVSACLKYSMMAHYFHFMEIIIALYSYIREYAPGARVEKIYIGLVTCTPLHEAVIAALFPGADIIIIIESEAVENLIYIDADYVISPINKFLDPLLMLAAKWGDQMRRDIYKYLGVGEIPLPESEFEVKGEQLPKCMYSKRYPPRCFSDADDEKIVNFLSIKTDLFSAEFSGVPWHEQVIQTSKCDMMFGIHGNGLTNLLWLPPHATVIEVFPRGAHHYDYQLMCEVMGLRYYGIEGDVIFRDFSRFGPSYGHNGEVTAIVPFPKGEILDFIFSEIELRGARGEN